MAYIHGFSEEEQNRLISQNEVLEPYIYCNLDFSSFTHIVEIGCGVGAQMITLLNSCPGLSITGIEQSPKQAHRARIHLSHFPLFQNRYDILEDYAKRIQPKFAQPLDAAFMV